MVKHSGVVNKLNFHFKNGASNVQCGGDGGNGPATAEDQNGCKMAYINGSWDGELICIIGSCKWTGLYSIQFVFDCDDEGRGPQYLSDKIDFISY